MAATFTCISCRVAFKDAEIQRNHYKTDWHRYNLKRKIAELPPVTAEDFQRRIDLQQEKVKAEAQAVSFHCEPCHKTFNSQNAYDNHLQSKKHEDVSLLHLSGSPSRSQEEAMKPDIEEESTDSEIEEVDSDEWENEGDGIPPTDCLFCPHHSATVSKNLKHMSSAHSFFIPDIEYVVDLQGLLEYLGEKVGVGFLCLWCSERCEAFGSLHATQKHMQDKSHCKVRHDGEALAEYVDFYDYSSSYPDQQEEGEEDMEVDLPEIDGTDYQLTLPSGATIGHRLLMRYYRQNLNPNRSLAPRSNVNKYMSHYRAIGYTESTKEAIARKQKDLKFMRKVQAKLHLGVGVRANKLQHHFRQQVNF